MGKHRRAPTILLAICAVAALSPSLFLGRIPAETDLLTQFGPWAPLPYQGHPITAGGDSFFAYLPDRLLAVDEWRHGRLPLWNPYISGGVPLLGCQTANPLDPFLALHLILPTGWAMGLEYAILLFLAGWGLARLLERRGVREPIALAAAGIAFALNPYFLYWLELRVFVAGLATLPLALWALECVVAAPKWGRNVAVLALCLGFAASAGTLQTVALFLFVLLVRSAWLIAERPPALPREKIAGAKALPAAAWITVGVVLGLALGSLTLIASLELFSQSTRVGASQGYYAESNRLSWRVFALWFSPDVYGWPSQRVDEIVPGFGRTIAASSGWGAIGILPLFLALYALVDRVGPRRERWFWGGLAAAPLLILFLLNSPLSEMVAHWWPWVGHVDLFRALFLVELGGAMLTGWGVERLIERWRAGRSWKGWLLPWTCFALAGAAALVAGRRGLENEHSLLRDLLPLMLLSVGMLAMGWGCTGRPPRAPRAAWLLPVLIALELGRIHIQFNRFGPAGSDFPPSPMLTDLASLLGPPDYPRFFAPGTARVLPPNTASALRLPDVRGYSNLPVRRYRELISCAEGKPLANRTYIERPESQVYRLLGGRYVLLYVTGEMIRPIYEPIPLRGTDPDGFFQRLDPLPRAFLMHQAAILGTRDLREVLSYLAFDPGALLVADSAAVPLPLLEWPETQESVRILAYGPTEIDVQVDAAAAGILVLTDAFYPGWKVRVDDVATRIFPVYFGLRGVGVLAGSHQVRFTYRPDWLLPAAVATLLALGGCLGALLRRGNVAVLESSRSRDHPA